MEDLTVTLDKVCLNIRAAGVVLHGDAVLVCRIPPDLWWFLPGGRVKALESSRVALERELTEELQGPFTIGRPLVASEYFFPKDGLAVHELCTYYQVHVEDPSALLLDGGREEFRWVARRDVMDLEIKPDFMKPYLVDVPTSLEIVVARSSD